MQTGFDAAKLKIQRNHGARKKRALDALHTIEKYKRMSSAAREGADTKITRDCGTRGDAELVAVAQQWKCLNQISDDESKDESNKSTDKIYGNSNDGSDDDNANDLDWESPDENERDTSDPEYEVDEITAAQEGVPYELDEDGEVSLNDETTAGLRHILERACQQNALFIKRVMELNG